MRVVDVSSIESKSFKVCGLPPPLIIILGVSALVVAMTP